MSNDPIAETDASGNTTNEYIFLGGKRIARRDSSANVFYYFSDHLSTSREIVQAGQTTPCYDADFYPYGGERVYTNTCPQNYKFTGKERDGESNLDKFGARYYSSGLGRFTSVDPKSQSAHRADPQTWNRYTYTRNNPLKYVDPDGMDIQLAAGQTPAQANRLVQLIVNDYKKESFRAEFNQLRDSPMHTTVSNTNIPQSSPVVMNPGETILKPDIGPNGQVNKNSSTMEIKVDVKLLDDKHFSADGEGQIVRHEFNHASRMEADPQSFVDADKNNDQAFNNRDETLAQESANPGNELDSMTPEAADMAVRDALGIDENGNALSPPPPAPPAVTEDDE
jgi:RHS repeat-associated protein